METKAAVLPLRRASETKDVRFERKTLDAARGEFEGYLSVFATEDAVGDIVERTAFTETLADAREKKRRLSAPFMFPLLWMHDVDRPVGGFDATEDAKGLYIKGRVDLNIDQGRWAFSGMSMGYMSGLSIGYDTIRSRRDSKGVRHLDETRLWEGSVCTSGYQAHADAFVVDTKSVKAGRGRDRLDQTHQRLEAALDSATAYGSRVPLGPPSAPPEPWRPNPPALGSMPSVFDATYQRRPDLYERDLDDWLAASHGLPSEATLRRRDDERVRAEMDRRWREQEDQRIATSASATVDELEGWARRHGGYLPDGRPLPTAAEDQRQLDEYRRLQRELLVQLGAVHEAAGDGGGDGNDNE